MLAELLRREKAAGIKPDPDLDVFMKVRKKYISMEMPLNLTRNLSTV